jgi:hypothetical protein
MHSAKSALTEASLTHVRFLLVTDLAHSFGWKVVDGPCPGLSETSVLLLLLLFFLQPHSISNLINRCHFHL